MSLDFSSVVTLPYSGLIISGPITLCTPSYRAPSASTVEINWQNIEVPKGITLNVAAQSGAENSRPIDKLASVFIDNNGCTARINMLSPDTGHVVSCGPGETCYAPVMTNGTNVIVYATGAAQFGVGTVDAGKTKLIFSNVYVSDANKLNDPGEVSNLFTWDTAGGTMAPGTYTLSIVPPVGMHRIQKISFQPERFNATVIGQNFNVFIGGTANWFWEYFFRSQTVVDIDTRNLTPIFFTLPGNGICIYKNVGAYEVKIVTTINSARFVLQLFGTRTASGGT